MTNLKIFCSFTSVFFMFSSCLSSAENKQKGVSEIEIAHNPENMDQETISKENSTKRLKYFNVTDTRNGMLIERYPFPADWKQHTGGEFAYTGPNGIKVYGNRGMNYAYSTDPTTLQLYQNVGMQVKYPLTMEQVVSEIFVAYATPLNRKLVKKYPLHQIKQFDQNLDNMLFKVDQNPKQLDAMGIEWVDPDGTKWLTVLHYQLEQGYNNVYWSYRASAISAEPAHFEQAKQDYLNGLLNRQINTKWIAAMNQQTEYTIRTGYEDHAKREAEFKRGVAQRQKQWEADQQQKANNQKQWEVNLEKRARTQEHISDVILGKTNIVDPETGERGKIDHKNDYYWVNSDGKYVGTDDYKYDPNKDDYINNRTWKEFKLDDYR